jgi:hypothetical protein
MTDSLLIYNERSGSCDPALLAEVESLFDQAGWPIGRKLAIGDGMLPGRHAAEESGLGLVVVLSGDGSLNSVADALAGWEGTLLVLPGGTMNLLARALHGERTVQEIVKAYLDGDGIVLRTPVLRAGDLTAYTGLIVGPSAAWADVREDMRNLDVASLASNVPRALAATLKDPGVALEGHEGEYPAIFAEPMLDGMHAYGVLAGGAGDLFRHGWAWLSGDFRNGPSEALGTAQEMSFRSSGDAMDLLVDGEKHDADNPLEVRLERSGVYFFAAQGDAAWR